MVGEATLQRTAYGVGQGEWETTDVVADDGQVSLREAIEAANANGPGEDVIEFNLGSAAPLINLTQSGTLSVGTVTWLLRAGSLLTGVFSSIPLWSSMDPLPILSLSRKEKRRRQGEQTGAGRQDAVERRMGRMLDGSGQGDADESAPR